MFEGRSVRVFDHPYDDQPWRVCNQGSAFPEDKEGNGITGTCGCCACATIINKAGGSATERSVVSYAAHNDMCLIDKDEQPCYRGSTSPNDMVNILGAAGIAASVVSPRNIESLAKAVEEGRGVIIGVSAYSLPWNGGHYSPFDQDGHAIVIDSVIRDANTDKILEFVVTDSNGDTSTEAIKTISAKDLQLAYNRCGRRAVVTDTVIW